MCFGGNVPDPVAPRQAAKVPDQNMVNQRIQDAAKRRMGYAASVLTPQAMGLAPAATTGKTLLGS